MYKGISINIGLNIVDPEMYPGSQIKDLKGCEEDAKFMSNLAKGSNFQSILLLGSKGEAKIAHVKNSIQNAKRELDEDGILVITYSGHGSQISNTFEPDGNFETWCLFDGVLRDFEIFGLLTEFEKTQRILIISDSCHSGTVVANIPSGFEGFLKVGIERIANLLGFSGNNLLSTSETGDNNSNTARYKFLSPENLNNAISKDDYINRQTKNKETLKEKLRKIKEETGVEKDYRDLCNASVLLLSACQDWQLAEDGENHGAFTQALINVLKGNGQIDADADESNPIIRKTDAKMNYIKLHELIWKKLVCTKQNPNFYRIGTPNADFEMQPWFTI
jgi:metacaspase-1